MNEGGVKPGSKVETFAAMRLAVNSWRWKDVPFFLRAGKCMPLTCTEVFATFRKPPTLLQESDLLPNHWRFRISPDMAIAIGCTVMSAGEGLAGRTIEMLASRHPRSDEMDAYERVLGDAMAGDATLFARQDYVEEAWRIVDPVLRKATPVYPYESKTWGPKEVDEQLAPACGWHNPTAPVEEEFSLSAGA